MSYLKICQISNFDVEVIKNNGNLYLEDIDGAVIINNPTYPLTLSCEVIEWVSEEQLVSRGEINSFVSEIVVLESAPENIREEVYQQLKVKYPNLNK